MVRAKILLIVLSILLFPCASGGGNETMFDAAFGGIFTDFESLALALVLVLVPIAALASFIAMVWGKYTHDTELHDKGVSGLTIIVKGAVLVFIVLNIFDYVVENYW